MCTAACSCLRAALPVINLLSTICKPTCIIDRGLCSQYRNESPACSDAVGFSVPARPHLLYHTHLPDRGRAVYGIPSTVGPASSGVSVGSTPHPFAQTSSWLLRSDDHQVVCGGDAAKRPCFHVLSRKSASFIKGPPGLMLPPRRRDWKDIAGSRASSGAQIANRAVNQDTQELRQCRHVLHTPFFGSETGTTDALDSMSLLK